MHHKQCSHAHPLLPFLFLHSTALHAPPPPPTGPWHVHPILLFAHINPHPCLHVRHLPRAQHGGKCAQIGRGRTACIPPMACSPPPPFCPCNLPPTSATACKRGVQNGSCANKERGAGQCMKGTPPTLTPCPHTVPAHTQKGCMSAGQTLPLCHTPAGM